MKQRRAHMLFQLSYARGDDRGCHAQLPRRLGKTLGLRDANKGFDVQQQIHGNRPLVLVLVSGCNMRRCWSFVLLMA
ncbi:hypothetical protein SDC9_97601 [bioreactor metagenome]|uniref:Uncharacterized protein n=1 Tax=bioreactor metagenome TaxID=1076179 RepID=A0A645ACC8_9ZZZZ